MIKKYSLIFGLVFIAATIVCVIILSLNKTENGSALGDQAFSKVQGFAIYSAILGFAGIFLSMILRRKY